MDIFCTNPIRIFGTVGNIKCHQVSFCLLHTLARTGKIWHTLVLCNVSPLCHVDILVKFRNGDRKIMRSIRILSRPPSRIWKWDQLSQFRWESTKYLMKRIKLATFRQWAKGSGEAAREGLTVLHICLCSLSNHYSITLTHLVNMA